MFWTTQHMLNLSTIIMLLLALVLAAPAAIAAQPSSVNPALPLASDSDKNLASSKNDQDKDDDDDDDEDDEDEDSSAEKPKPVDAQTAGMLRLAQKSGCLACHKLERKLVGPGWNDVALRYRNDPNARAKLIEKVSRGGGGNWTEVTDGKQMPPYGERVNPTDIATLVDFVLSLPPP